MSWMLKKGQNRLAHARGSESGLCLPSRDREGAGGRQKRVRHNFI